MKGNLFMLGWPALGSPGRRWQVQYCVDRAEAERIAAGLVKSDDGGGRWRVYGLTREQLPDAPIRFDRGDLLAAGVAQSGTRQAEGIYRQGGTAGHRSGDGSRFGGCFRSERMGADPLRGRAAGGGERRPGGRGRAIRARCREERRWVLYQFARTVQNLE